MKVILSENVMNLGDMGAEVNVAAGYARNFLFPRKLAVGADSASGKEIEHHLRNIKKKEEKHKAVLQGVAKKLEAVTVALTARAGAGDKLFGSITTIQIAEKLKEQGHDIERRMIVLSEPIKTLGIHAVTVKLGNGVEGSIKVWVSKEADEETADAEVAAAEEAEAAEEDAEPSES